MRTAASLLWFGIWPALAATAPQVEQFSPQGAASAVRQVSARFSAPMTALGDPRLPAPFSIDCPAPGTGRWVDSRQWAYDFAADLESGLRCRFTLTPDLRTLQGEPLEGPREFAFDTGGPTLRASLPAEGSDDIDEQQVFILAPTGPVDPASVAAHARCDIEGVAEAVGVELAPPAEREQLLAQQRSTYAYANLLPESNAGPLPAAARRRAEEWLLALRCRRVIPPAAEVTLVWAAGVAAPSGVATAQAQRLTFTSRPVFSAEAQCERLNARRPCLPLRPLKLVFSAPVATAAAKAIRLVGEDGKTYRDATLDSEPAPWRRSLRFPGPFPPNARLRLEIPADLVDDAGRPLANAARFPLELATDEYPPLAKFAGEFGLIEAQEGGILPVTLRNLESPTAGRQWTLAGRLQRQDDDQAIFRWLRRVREAMAPRGDWQELPNGDRRWRERTGDRSVFQDSADATAFTLPRGADGKAFEVIGIPLRRAGFYVVELASPRLGEALLDESKPRYVATTALVTNLAVHYKQGRESSLVWVTRLDDGRPVSGADVRISDACQGESLWQGATDADGLARVAAALPKPADGEPECHMVSARTAEDMSFALASWSRGIEPDDFNLKTGFDDRETLAHTVFDRPLFRAGETVSMKHFIRRHTERGLEFATTPLPQRLRIAHSGGGQEYTLPLTLDGGGIGESRWDIPPDAKLGRYQVSLEGDNELRYDSGSFRVEQFRLPTMKALLQPTATPAARPTAVTVDILVGYLNGGGAAGLPVKLRTLTEPRHVAFPDYADYEFDSENLREGVESAAEDESAEDEGAAAQRGGGPAGVLALTLDAAGAARATLSGTPPVERPLDLLAELDYPDANGERLTVASRLPLWPAAVVVGLRTEGWLLSPDAVRLRVATLDVQGKPAPDRPVTVELWRRTTYSYRKRLLGGFYGYEHQRETRRLGVGCEGRTDRQGLLLCELKPGASGDLILLARTEDSQGNRSVATKTIWVSGADDWFAAGDSDRMDVLPERPAYEPGETARLQARLPFRAATALVTVEREGVLDSFVTALSGRQSVVELPLKNNYAPNIYVSVLAVRGRVGQPPAGATPADADGGPITATVDLNKPAYRLGIAPLRVGWTPHRLEVRVTPERDSYRPREVARVTVAVRRADGGPLPPDAEIALAAVDEGLLELKANDSWRLLERMMEERGVEVRTATAQMQVVGKRHYGRKALPPGGGGGRQATRELFDTLLLWRGRAPLDAQGMAVLDVPLNDSLTAFRLTAIASAGAGGFGAGAASIRATQELMLHAGLPPLLREGDRFDAAFTVRNASQQPLTALATAQVSAANGPPPPLEPPSYRLELKPGEARELVWTLTAPVGAGALLWELSAQAEGNPAADRLRVKLPVQPALPTRITQATLLRLEQPLTVAVQRPADALPDRGGVRVSLRARLGDGLGGVSDYMSRYPYSCLEQRVSRAVALRNPALWQAIAQALPAYIDQDGLLRYFPGEDLPGEDALTSYVLAIAQEAQWSLPAEIKSKLIQGLKAFVQGRVQRDSAAPAPDLALRKLAAIAALARYGEAQPEMLATLTLEPAQWPTSALLDWLELLQRLPTLPQQAARLEEAQRLLRARLVVQGTVMNLSTGRSDALWWLMISPDLNAVRALLAAAALPAWRADIPRLARGALARQRGGHWDTTTANAWGVLALEQFSRLFEPTPVAGYTQAQFNDVEKGLEWLATTQQPALNFPWPATGQGELQLAHKGQGRPWAIVQTRAATPLRQPVFAGYRLQRRVTPVIQQHPGRWTRGDVARVRLELEAQADMSWVVVDDPVPAGATLLGSGLGRDAELLTRDEQRAGAAWPAYEERRADAFRAYYRFVPKGQWTVEYSLRYNTAGRFELPPSRVEALYAPEMFGETPNEAVAIDE